MNEKLVTCKDFSDFLKKNHINHEVYNNGYHIQVQIQHNFYPSTGIYYNSASGKKFKYPLFEDGSTFLNFLSKNVK